MKIHLTFDIDWADDTVIRDTIEILMDYDARATFFVTHDTPVLDELRKNSDRFELGIHPNYNNLLKNDSKLNYLEVTKAIKEIVPEAVSARSHSMTQGSLIFDVYQKCGIDFDVNTLIPAQTGMVLKPFKTPSGLIRIPYFWEDDDHAEYGFEWNSIEFLRDDNGLKVFDFHPIHVFLNMENMERYNQIRLDQKNIQFLTENKNKNEKGSRDFLIELLKNDDLEFGLIKEITI